MADSDIVIPVKEEQSPHIPSKVAKIHIPKRVLPQSCLPKKYVGTYIIVDEVQPTEDALYSMAGNVIAIALWKEINKLCFKMCYGCSVDHPSQIQHDLCIMATDDERLDMFFLYSVSYFGSCRSV